MARALAPLCDNMNHRRPNAPVAHCSECGHVVNHNIARGHCQEDRHALARRRQSKFCVDCGKQLIVSR